MTGRFEDMHGITKRDLQIKYEKFGSLRGVAKEYGTDHNVIRGMMGRFGLNYKVINYKSLPVNHDFFSEHTYQSCYWAGFLAADGCIHNKYVKLSLSEKDLNHLMTFKEHISSEHKLTKTESKGSVCYCLSVSSSKMVSDLKKFGVVPRKTQTLDFPKIPSALASYFCRGYFDGDGCWAVHKPSTRPGRKGQLVFSTRGTEKFLEGFNKCLVNYAGLPERCLDKSLKGWRTSVLQYNGNNICRKIADWLYKDIDNSDVFLDRKYQIVYGDRV